MPKLVLLLCLLGGGYIATAHAVDWQIKPRLDVAETYSDNITLASDSAIASDDYITQLSPAITINGIGNRLKLDSSYTLQNLFYANDSSRNQSYNQLKLGADAELIEDLFYLVVDGQVFQQQLTSGQGVAADNLNVGSGRGDVVTTQFQPSIRRRLGKYVEFDLSYSESRVNYGNASMADVRMENTRLSLGGNRAPAKLDWKLNYSESRQRSADTRTSERQQSSATLRYAFFDHVSFIANGGKEDGYIVSSKSYNNGTYWSAGIMWKPSSRLSIDAAKGNNDRQVNLMWAPSARTSLSGGYLDRKVGIRASNTRTGLFKHSNRRTLWTLSYVEEITSDAVLAIVNDSPVAMLDKNGGLIFDELGHVVVTQGQLGIVDELFRRESAQGSFTWTARKNDVSLGVSSEQRRYELTDRQAQLHGSFVGWRLRLSARASSSVNYSVNRSTESSASNEIETTSLSWSLNRMLGKRITTGLELKTTEVDGGVAALSRSENRISANARVIF